MLYDNTLTAYQNVAKAVAGDCELDLGGVRRWIKEPGTLAFHEGLKVFNGTFATAAVVDFQVVGSHVTLDIGLDVAGYNSPNAILELVEADYLTITNMTITGNTPRKSILCRSTMSNVLIDGLKIMGNQAWGILLNDSIKERGRNYRFVNGRDYADIPMGKNIYIRNVEYGYGLVDRPGDAVEINNPDCGIHNVTIENVKVHKTITSGGSDGIGIGCANNTNLIVRNVDVAGAQKFALHIEKGQNHLFEYFNVQDSARALSLSHTTNSTFRNGVCKDSGDLIISYNRLTEAEGFGPGKNILFENITFDKWTGNGVLIANSDGYRFKNVTFRDFGGAEGASIVKLYQQRPENGGANNNMFENVTFERVESTTTPSALIEVEQGVGNRFGNVVANGYENKVIVNGNEIHV